jgi:hypothetical protein
MNSTIFSTPNDSYAVSNVIYAGPVMEIPEEKRKSESQYSFRMITTLGPVYCYFKTLESAKKARNLLGSMMNLAKPSVFRSGPIAIDPSKIVSFSKVVTLKNPENGFTHAITTTIETSNNKTNQIWMTYRSEEAARNARRALYASIQSLNRVETRENEIEENVADCSTELESVAA